jgi:hypothetical protein
MWSWVLTREHHEDKINNEKSDGVENEVLATHGKAINV